MTTPPDRPPDRPPDQPPDQAPDSERNRVSNEGDELPAEVYGAAPERTILAWQRPGLGVVVCSFLIFHTAIQLGVLTIGLLAGGLGLVVAALAVFSFPAQRHLAGRPADSWRLLITVTGSVVGLGVLGAVTGAMTLHR